MLQVGFYGSTVAVHTYEQRIIVSLRRTYEQLTKLPKCNSEYVYEDGSFLIRLDKAFL